MKKLYIFGLILALWLGVSHQSVFAQAEVKHYTASFSITDSDSGIEYEFDAPANEIITPGGNFLKSLRIKVDKTHVLMQHFGGFPNRWFEFNYLFIDIGNDGEYNKEDGDVLLTDGIAKLNKSGNMTIQFHLNGAGTYLPLGW
ncbi:hypothetical protein OU798_15565 [Prolixibacteraceae bacterium Z1-6]|uniref:Uncharacterized protein n=1 Tax=Draconibacterium aestuarii TaxID=2998507 RepID=A0A9X3F8Q5_9BACT|nr:hypothetical protein [Prolixibacteraceae bacterium Z1-6]